MPYKEKFQYKLAEIFQDLTKVHGDTYAYLGTYALEGGKQIRPMLFLEMVSYWNGEVKDEDIQIACALELLHIFFLIHDDVMDEDQMRRDKLTLHAHFVRHGMLDGVGRAVVWGDVLFCKALQLLSTYPDPQKSLLLIQYMLDVSEKTAQGQLLEANREQLPDMEDLLNFYAKKTALYSIYLPLISAAVVSSQLHQQEDILKFSSDLGIALQLYDDLIEVTGEKKRQEDSDRCGDIMRLKATPLLIQTLPFLPADLQSTLKEKYYANTPTTYKEETAILQCMWHHGTVEEACVQIQSYAKKAKVQGDLLGVCHIELIAKLLELYAHTTAKPLSATV